MLKRIKRKLYLSLMDAHLKYSKKLLKSRHYAEMRVHNKAVDHYSERFYNNL